MAAAHSVSGQHLPSVDVGGAAPAGVQGGQIVGGGDVHVSQTASGAGGGLIDMQHPAWRYNCRIRGRKVCFNIRAARPRTEAINPTGTGTSTIERINRAARATGR